MKRTIIAVALLSLVALSSSALTQDGLPSDRCPWLTQGYFAFAMLFSDGSELSWSGKNQTDCAGDTRRLTLDVGVYCPNTSSCLAQEMLDSGWQPPE
jgi:hypothetical protein